MRINIKNWNKFQHYKDRRPKWIKLLIEIIDEFDADGLPKKFHALPDSAKLTFLLLACLRANYNKHIPYPSGKWLAKRLGISKVNLQPLIDAEFICIDTELIQDDTELLQNRPKLLPPEREREGYKEEKEREGRFTPPSLEDIQSLIKERGYTVDPNSFLNFYVSKGWMVGKNKMKDWRASLAGWESRNEGQSPKHKTASQVRAEYAARGEEI